MRLWSNGGLDRTNPGELLSTVQLAPDRRLSCAPHSSSNTPQSVAQSPTVARSPEVVRSPNIGQSHNSLASTACRKSSFEYQRSIVQPEIAFLKQVASEVASVVSPSTTGPVVS